MLYFHCHVCSYLQMIKQYVSTQKTAFIFKKIVTNYTFRILTYNAKFKNKYTCHNNYGDILHQVNSLNCFSSNVLDIYASNADTSFHKFQQITGKIIITLLEKDSCAIAEAVCCWPVTAEGWIQSQASPCGICHGRSGKGTGFYPNTNVFPHQYHSLVAPFSFTHLALTL